MGLKLIFLWKKAKSKATKKYREKLGLKPKMSTYTEVTKNGLVVSKILPATNIVKEIREY